MASATPADFFASVARVPAGTAIQGSMAGTMNVAAEHVYAVMCDYDHYHRFSHTIRSQAAVPPPIQAQLERSAADAADISRYIVAGAEPIHCPGENAVLTYLQYPFPLRDKWVLAKYLAESTANTYSIHYERLAGTSTTVKGQTLISRRDAQHCRFEMRYTYDMSSLIPNFIIRWGGKKEMASMFEEIERLAQERALLSRTPRRERSGTPEN
jgi:hypothetical protein